MELGTADSGGDE